MAPLSSRSGSSVNVRMTKRRSKFRVPTQSVGLGDTRRWLVKEKKKAIKNGITRNSVKTASAGSAIIQPTMASLRCQ